MMKGVGWATLVSVSVHLVLGWIAVRMPTAWLVSPAAPESIAVEIIALDDPAPEPRALPVEPPLPDPDPLEPDALPEPTPQDVGASLRPDVTPLDDVAPGEPDGEPGGEPGEPGPVTEPGIDVPSITPDRRAGVDTSDRRAMQALLNPSAVARGGFVPTGPGPSRRGPPAGLNGGTGTEAPTEEQIEAQHNSFLRGQAMARPWLSRTEPDLHRQPDGTYQYAGHRFQATIRRDGTVDFEDQGNVQADGFSTSGSFDITDAIMGAAGQDPHAAERAWFMRHTRELRHRLEAEHRAQQNSRALERLPGRLAGIWRTASRTTSARRRRIFRIWDEMDTDDNGRRARAIVIAFIREAIPAGSEDEYTDAEIDRLNARRESTERFDPY